MHSTDYQTRRPASSKPRIITLTSGGIVVIHDGRIWLASTTHSLMIPEDD